MVAWLAGLVSTLLPAVVQLDYPLRTRGYLVGQIESADVFEAAAVINRCFFAGSREGPHRTDLISNALRARAAARLDVGGIAYDERSSLVLAVTPDVGAPAIVAMAELSMQPRNGQVPGNFRPLVFPGNEPMVPYICNLAVDANHRHRGLARSVMAVCEEITRAVWGYGEIFLHVDERNAGAAQLYASLGYEPLPHWDQPLWKEANLGLAPFRYHRKIISADSAYTPIADCAEAAAASREPREAPVFGFAVPSDVVAGPRAAGTAPPPSAMRAADAATAGPPDRRLRSPSAGGAGGAS